MSPEEFEGILASGESSSVEFKRCGGLPEDDVYETICSFGNRYGGNIFLGVLNDGTVEGVNPKRVDEIQRNLVNRVCNPNQFDPSPMVETEVLTKDGLVVIRVWVPMSASVIRFKGVAYDRAFDVDRKVTGDYLLSQLYMRKQNYYYEQKVFPSLTLDDFRVDLIDRCRRMAVARRPDHPWRDLTTEELLKSANLWGVDISDKTSGYRLAAVLLLGKDSVIGSLCPAYRTDAIVRRVDLDRYDDRLLTKTNLVESYDLLTGFARRQLPDSFYLENDQSVSPRDIIVRELIANLLIHREYSSPMPGMLVIGNDGIRTENASRSFYEGRLDPDNFNPMSKNPIIAGFFTEIGLADELGSGMRNLYKYSRRYTGREPEFSDGDVFRAFVPVEFMDGSTTAPQEQPRPNVQDKHPEGMAVDDAITWLLDANGTVTSKTVAELAHVTPRTANRHLVTMTSRGILVAAKKGRFIVYERSAN